MPYNLPPAVDTEWHSYAQPDAQIPVGATTTPGLNFLQFNSHRIGLVFQNNGAGSVVFISDRPMGFDTAFQLTPAMGIFQVEWPPRAQLFAWKTGASDFRYLEHVYQPFRASVSENQIRSGVQRV